jgi:hypothetical protein
MKKLFDWCKDNVLLILALLLLVFIPLYPKLPLVDIRNTWVYIRIEDVLVLVVLSYWGMLIVRKKIDLKTPLTVPMLLFWLSGAIATVHGMLLIFPDLAYAYPNVAFLSFIRRIEYMSVFFIAYHAVKDSRIVSYIVVLLSATVFIVSVYGIGQKYFGFYAFLTMNEEFAKGIPIQLSALSRISSTFGGHYDLAAYLVLMLPILISMMFAFKNWLARSILLATSVLGFIVLFLTVSRISFFAFFISIGIVLLFQKKKIVLVSIPLILLAALIAIRISPTISNRFGKTIKEIDILVDAKTGVPIAHTTQVPNTYFVNKLVKQQFSNSISNLAGSASPSSVLVFPYTALPAKVDLFVEPNAPTGEDLPSGTGYINLALSPVKRKLGNFYFEPKPREATTSAEVFVINGDYLVKKVLAYDLSFTTRFQGGWPHTLAAFKRNIFIGSGYGSVGLAVDNSYLRMLGEVGLLGFGSFLFLFIVIGLSIRNALPSITSRIDKSFIIGFLAGAIGLAINALFIDVFEASKVAFSFWLLTGFVIGIIRLYQKAGVDLANAMKRVVSSNIEIAMCFLVAAIVLYSSTTKNYFVGDDFTWFRWAGDSGQSAWSTIAHYFTQADGFFYRPGTKIYFLLMYSFFWLNQTAYHFVSVFLHFLVATLVFVLAKKILKGMLLPALAGFLFLLLSGYSEAVHWISATGFLFTASFSLLSLLSYIAWEEKKKIGYFIATFTFLVLSLLFHESGLVTPLFYLLYRSISRGTIRFSKLLLIPIPVYLLVRFFAQSHWLAGDYSYNLVKFPFNAVGNAVGYFFLALFGPVSTSFYQIIRNALREHMVIAGVIAAGVLVFVLWANKILFRKITKGDRKIYVFGLIFFIISLLPFLGLGNMSSRYSYVASIGIVFLLVLFLKKLYEFLLPHGRAIAWGAAAVVLCVFGLFQIIQQQQIHSDWYEAGEKSRKFIVAMQGAYEDYWATEPIELHLVNVPIRSGQAWIFPVGISDALWMLFRNPRMRVYSWPSTSAALNAVGYTSTNKKIFEFTGDGKVDEIRSNSKSE